MLKAKTTKLALSGDLDGHWVEVREFTWGEIKAIRAADATEDESTDRLLSLISSHNLGVDSLDELPLSAMIVIATRMRDWIEELTERTYQTRGVSRRSFNLAYKISSKYDLSKGTAAMENGLLNIQIPFAEEAKPRTLQIK